jgi:RimJ/RimL family protein N-acetyltransferase
VILKGKKVDYRSLGINDASSFHQWCKNKDAVRYSLSWFQTQRSINECEKWLTEILDSKRNFNIGVCCKSSGNLIGYAGIADKSSMNRSGEYFILIGESDHWGQGIGTEVTKTVTSYGVNTLGLHRVFLTVSELNHRAIKAYENADYKHEGILRDAAFRDGEFHNKILMSILSTEWTAY